MTHRFEVRRAKHWPLLEPCLGLGVTFALLVLLLWIRGTARGQESEGETRFEAVDIFVDTGAVPLAAYQAELLDPTGRSRVVGLEGGEHPAFRAAPYYDPAALRRSRVIIAAFSTGGELPEGRTRVARVHLEVQGVGRPDLSVRLVVAATREGQEVPAAADLGSENEEQ